MRGMVKMVTWDKIAQLWLYSKRTRMHDWEPTVMSTLSLPLSWSFPQQTEQNGTRQRHEMIDRSQMAVGSVHVPVESLKGPPARCEQPKQIDRGQPPCAPANREGQAQTTHASGSQIAALIADI